VNSFGHPAELDDGAGPLAATFEIGDQRLPGKLSGSLIDRKAVGIGVLLKRLHFFV
jgi:hypothetical protein